MSITSFYSFLTTASLHHGLLVDLCAEQGVITRAQLLAYMERHGIAPVEKDKLIERYCRASILNEEDDFEYTVNPIVADLVNFYERRGKLTNADFLRDQIFEIGNLTDTLQQIVNLLEPRAEEQGLALELKLPEDLPLVQADERSMEEVFTNLISNAINYSPEGGTVVVAANKHIEFVEVRVSDTGVGIAAEELPKIFDKFYRVKHPQTRQVIGTGLGLSIVKGVVEAHRGSVEVESIPGEGTTFKVLLPIISEGKLAVYGKD